MKKVIGYIDENDYKIKPMCKMLSKMSNYFESFDHETKWMNFLIQDDEMLKKYTDIWNGVNNSVNKELDYKSNLHCWWDYRFS